MGLCRLLNRHNLCNHGSNSLTRYQLQYVSLIFYTGTQLAATNDVHAFKPAYLCINGGLLASQVANQYNTSIRTARFDTILKGCADQFDHQVDTVGILYDLSHLLLSMVDYHIGPHAAHLGG